MSMNKAIHRAIRRDVVRSRPPGPVHTIIGGLFGRSYRRDVAPRRRPGRGDGGGKIESALLPLLTAMESLSTMLASRRVDPARVFGGLRAIVVYEVHANAGDDPAWLLLSEDIWLL
jgi:hypothetical protein